MATPTKPGPNQQRATDNFLLPQVKWVELHEREGCAMQAREQWLSEAFALVWQLVYASKAGGKFRRDAKICRPFSGRSFRRLIIISNDQEPEKNVVVYQPLRMPRFVGIPLALSLQNPKACSGD